MTATLAKFPAVLVIALALCACASTPPPTDALAAARAAVGRAAASDLPPSARAELDVAEARLQQAREAVDARDYALARVLADEATLAADVAQARTRAARARAEVERASAENARLRAELLTAGGGL